MKINNETIKSPINRVFAFAFVLAIFISGCAHKTSFPVSSVLPAADATVEVKKDKNGNYAIDLETENMASPQRLQPQKNTYVVWVENDQNEVKNIGRLDINKLKGSLKTVVPNKPSRIFITAEDNATTDYPGMVVLETGVSGM